MHEGMNTSTALKVMRNVLRKTAPGNREQETDPAPATPTRTTRSSPEALTPPALVRTAETTVLDAKQCKDPPKSDQAEFQKDPTGTVV